MFSTPWRLLVAVAMIALPVATATAMAVSAASTEANHIPGAYPYTVSYEGGSCSQNADGSKYNCTGATDANPVPKSLDAHLRNSLPQGLRAEFFASFDVTASSEHGTRSTIGLSQYELAALPEGYRSLLSGGGIVLSEDAANSLRVSVGDTLTVSVDSRAGASQQPRKLQVVGVSPSSTSAVAAPTLIADASELMLPNDKPIDTAYPRWALHSAQPAPSGPAPAGPSPAPLTWDDVTALNAAGFVVTADSDHPIDGAPPLTKEDKVGRGTAQGDRLFGMAILSIYGIAAFLILLFIAPVFSLALSRHTKLFALMNSQGASPRHIRMAVLGYAAVTGLLGASAGLALGGAWAFAQWQWAYPGWPMSVDWWALLLFFAAAVVGSMLIALIPAYIASRNALSAAIAGAEPDRIVRWRRWMAAGPVYLAVLAIALAASYAVPSLGAIGRYMSTGTIPVLLALPGLAASTPALLFLVAGALGRGPLVLRTASRGLLRRSVRTLPLIAALLCLSFVGTLFVVGADAQARRDSDRETAYTSSPMAVVSINDYSRASAFDNPEAQKQLEESARAVIQHVGAARSWKLRGIPAAYSETPGGANVLINDKSRCSVVADNDLFAAPLGVADPRNYRGSNGQSAATDIQAAKDCRLLMSQFTSSSPMSSSNFDALVQEPGDLGMWAMRAEEHSLAEKVLRDGGVLVARGTPLDDQRNGVGRIEVETNNPDDPDFREAKKLLPATAVLPEATYGKVVLSPQAASALELKPVTMGYIVPLPESPDSATYDELRAAATNAPGALKNAISVSVNVGADSVMTFAVLIVVVLAAAASLLVMVLAAQGLRRDSAVLLAVGASPGTTAAIAAVQAALTVAIGMGGGVLLGHLVTLATAPRDAYSVAGDLISVGTAGYLAPSWPLIGGTVAVTVLAAACAWVLHRPGTTEPEVARRRD